MRNISLENQHFSRIDSINKESKSYIKTYDYLNLVVKRLEQLVLTRGFRFNIDKLNLKISVCIYEDSEDEDEDDDYSYS